MTLDLVSSLLNTIIGRSLLLLGGAFLGSNGSWLGLHFRCGLFADNRTVGVDLGAGVSCFFINELFGDFGYALGRLLVVACWRS